MSHRECEKHLLQSQDFQEECGFCYEEVLSANSPPLKKNAKNRPETPRDERDREKPRYWRS